FSVKYILVLTSEETNSRIFGELLSSTQVDGQEYLLKFTRLRRLSDHPVVFAIVAPMAARSTPWPSRTRPPRLRTECQRG
ncbi:Polysaccharide biosynthesis protein, partial [Operophtera brumata]